MGMYSGLVPRAPVVSDVFNAVAEPRRREILNYLALREHPVGEIATNLRLEQPSVSKHLRVLLETDLVHVRRDGRRMLYRTNAEAIRPLHEWAGQFERFWKHQLTRIKERAEETELARRLVTGDDKAFDRFVEHFRAKIFQYSWLMCGQREDAEEVAQDTLLKVFENFDQLREPERVRPWIFRIARNACLMQRRRSVFAPPHELSLAE